MRTPAWFYDLLKPHVAEVLVCNPRKIPLLKQGNKSDKIDARKLAERLHLAVTVPSRGEVRVYPVPLERRGNVGPLYTPTALDCP